MQIKPRQLIVILLLNSCVSVWPTVCNSDWRGRVTCKCDKEIRFKVSKTDIGKRVTVLCDGNAIPISADSTQVVSQ